jgi:hypothetical protein
MRAIKRKSPTYQIKAVIQNTAKRQRIAKHWLIFILKIFKEDNMFWQKTDKEKLMELLEWLLSHNWEFKKTTTKICRVSINYF